MRPDLEKIEMIENYLLGKLSGEELLQFEKEMESNSILKEEVEVQRYLMMGVENAGIRKSLNHIHVNLYENSFTYFLKKWGVYFAAGILVIGLTTTALLVFNIEETKNDVDGPKVLYSEIFPGIDTVKISDKELEEEIASSFINEKQHPVFFEHLNPLEKFFSKYDIPDSYFYIHPGRDTIITGKNGTRINIPSGVIVYEDGQPATLSYTLQLKELYKKSEIILNDLAGKSSANLESSGGIFIDAFENDKQLRLAQGKNLMIDFSEKYVPHVSNPHGDSALTSKSKDALYYKVFDTQTERRLIILPAFVLDYDIIYTRKSADPVMIEKVESLLLPQFENTFTSTTQFHYRLEGCQLFGKGVELLDIYLNNTHLKLWQADSLVVDYLNSKAYEDCNNFAKYMKASEYFRWLMSLRHGRVERIHNLDYRNYRKGQFYNKLPDKVLEKYLKENGLTENEIAELIDYFKKMYYYQKMFTRKLKYIQSPGLDYYYQNEGKFIAFEKNNCSDKVGVEKKYVYKTGDKLGSATELSYFMPVNRLGWINSERFVNYKNTVPLNVSLEGIDTTCYAKVYIVFKDVYAVLGGSWTKKGSNYFDRIPKGSKVYLIALAYDKDLLYYARKELLVGSQGKEIIELKKTKEALIRQDLMMLDY